MSLDISVPPFRAERKSQYWNRDIRIVRCQPRVRFVKMAESIVKFLPLEDANSAVWSHFGFPARNGKILESDRTKRQLVYCKLFVIKQLS